jgi:hypothetical protein
MSDIGQVHFVDTGVCLYTHWGAPTLVEDVKRALAKRWRWDDHEYLARIVFDEMVGNEHGEETGFGIGTDVHLDVVVLITIEGNELSVDKYPGTEFEQNIFNGTFEEFLKEAIS